MIVSLFGYAVALTLIGFSLLYLKWQRKVKEFSYIPTPKGMLPIFGHIFSLPKDITMRLEYNKAVFGELKSKIRLLWLGFLPIVDYFDINILEDVLKSNKYTSKGFTYRFFDAFLKSGLATSNGEKWKSRRRLLTPAFHFGILKSSASIINQHACLMVDHLKEKLQIDCKLEMQAFFKPFSLAVICETAMGVRLNLFKTSITTEESNYVAAINEIQDLFISRIYKPWLHNDFIYKHFSSEGKRFYNAVNIAHSFVRNVIESRVNILKHERSNRSPIFVDILIDAYKKNEIDMEGIFEEVNTFMAAGHETVSTALAWVIFRIGHDERIQEKLYREIECFDLASDLDIDSLIQLKYLDCVIKETLRLCPPIPFISRYIEEDAILGKVKIPAGCALGMHFYFLHRDETVWEKPSEFIPERFLNYNLEKRNPYAFCPFSAGPRNCIGQRFALLEMKIILWYLITNFRLKSIQKESDLLIYFTTILQSKDGIWVEIFERK